MKFLLTTLNSKYIHSNLAVYSLKAWADSMQASAPGNDEDNVTEIAEYTINQPPDKVLADIFDKKPDVLFMSCYIWNISQTVSLAEDISKVRPDLDIWLGGPEVSFHEHDTMVKFPFIRGIMSGEGERSFGSIISAYSRSNKQNGTETILLYGRLAETAGIAYRDENGNICINERSAPLDLSQVPFPYRDLSEFSSRIVYYESSRGCPYRCSYCLSSVDKRLRLRDTDKVKAELKFFLDRNVPQVKFIDRTFNCDHRHAMDIWQFIKDNDNGVTNFHFEIAADLLTDDELGFLAELRPGQIQFEAGIQTTNPETLKAINRTMDTSKVRSVVSRIRQAGNIHIHLDLIAGLPYEDLRSFAASFDDVFDMRPEQLQLGFLKILKGTAMEEKSRQYGMVYRSYPPYEILSTSWISYEELIMLKGVEEMVDVYYNSGQFERSLEKLLGLYTSPFEMFRQLSDWYAQRRLDMVNLSRNSRYEIFLDFAEHIYEEKDADSGDFMEELICDYYLRDNVKNRPGFFGESSVDKAFAAAFYRAESEEHRYLSGAAYEGADIRMLRRTTHLENLSGKYLLFDYSERDPMHGNARMIEIDSRCYGKYNEK